MVHVATADGARGDDDAAAHRRRDDVARPHGGQDRAARTRRRSSTSQDASRAVGVAGALLDRGGREAYAAAVRDEYEAVRRERDGRDDRETPAVDRRGAGEPAGGGLARPRRRVPTFLGVARVRATTRSTSSSSASTGRRSSRPGSCGAPTRRSSTTRAVGRGGARPVSRRPARCSTGSSTSGCSRRAPSSGSGRPTRRPTTTSSCGPTRRATGELGRLHALRQQMAKPDGRPNVSVADFVGPAGRARTTSGAFAVTAGHGIGRARRAVRGGQRRLLGDPGQGPRRPARGGARGADARAGPARAVGLRAGRGAVATTTSSPSATRASGRRPGYPATPDHLAKATLFELLDAEAQAGHAAHRVDGDAARGVGVGALPVAPRVRTTSGSGGWARPARGLRPPGRDAGRRGRAAGSRRTSRTTPFERTPDSWTSRRILRHTMDDPARAAPRRRLAPLVAPACSRRVLARHGPAAADDAGSRPPRRPPRQAVPREPRERPRLRPPDELRPVRRRERPDDAQHHAPGRGPDGEDPAPAPGPGPRLERPDGRTGSSAAAPASAAGRRAS